MRIVNEISNDPNDIIVIHKEKIYSFTVEEILKRIESRPVYVTQPFKITNDNREHHNEIQMRLERRQTIKNQQIIFINTELSLDFSFIELFSKQFNTFQTKEGNEEIKFLFQSTEAEFKTFNIETKVYSCVSLNRENCSDKYGSELEIIENIDINNIVKQKCDSVLLNDIKDQNIIMFYLENNPNAIACFEKYELVGLINQAPGMNDKFIKINNLLLYLLPVMFVYVESVSLLSSLNTGANTHSLIEAGSFERSILEVKEEKDELTGQMLPKQKVRIITFKYYTVKPVSRDNVFPNLNLPSEIEKDEIKEEIKNMDFFKDEEGNTYIRKTIPVFDEDTGEIIPNGKEIHTVKIPVNDKYSQLLHSLNGEPAVIRFIDNIKRKEVWYKNGETYRDGDQPIGIFYYKNGQIEIKRWLKNENELFEISYFKNEYSYSYETIKSKIWYKNGFAHRDDDEPAIINYYENGKTKTESWYKNGDLHRDGDQPAVIQYNKNKTIKSKEWYKNGEIKRDGDQPAKINYKNGEIEDETWYKNEEIGRDGDQPAVIRYKKNKIWAEGWYQNGKICRYGDKPAVIQYNENKQTIREEWYQNDEIHRDGDQPAVIRYYENNKVQSKEWYKNGERHRDENKPAIIRYNENEQIISETWYRNGFSYNGKSKLEKTGVKRKYEE